MSYDTKTFRSAVNQAINVIDVDHSFEQTNLSDNLRAFLLFAFNGIDSREYMRQFRQSANSILNLFPGNHSNTMELLFEIIQKRWSVPRKLKSPAMDKARNLMGIEIRRFSIADRLFHQGVEFFKKNRYFPGSTWETLLRHHAWDAHYLTNKLKDEDINQAPEALQELQAPAPLNTRLIFISVCRSKASDSTIRKHDIFLEDHIPTNIFVTFVGEETEAVESQIDEILIPMNYFKFDLSGSPSTSMGFYTRNQEQQHPVKIEAPARASNVVRTQEMMSLTVNGLKIIVGRIDHLDQAEEQINESLKVFLGKLASAFPVRVNQNQQSVKDLRQFSVIAGVNNLEEQLITFEPQSMNKDMKAWPSRIIYQPPHPQRVLDWYKYRCITHEARDDCSVVLLDLNVI